MGQSLVAPEALAEGLSDENRCFSYLANSRSPFEIYLGMNPTPGTFLQKPEPAYGLSKNAVRFLDLRKSVQIVELCDGKFIALWPTQILKGPGYLSGRSLGADGQAWGPDFEIRETYDISVGHIDRLYDEGYVVVWTASPLDEPTYVQARVFAGNGRPLTHPFTVAKSDEDNGVTGVTSLPNGTFAVTWTAIDQREREIALFLRIFKKNGETVSSKIQIASKREWSRLPHPILWVHSDSTLTIFFNDFRGTFDRYVEPLPAAQRYDPQGQPLIPLQKGQEVKSLDGYQEVVERLASNAMASLEPTLRAFWTKDIMGSHSCSWQRHSETLMANRMKMFSKDPRKKEFFTTFCRQIRTECGHLDVEPEELAQCVTDNSFSPKKD
ncbi:MAG: hypothetical protein OEY86_20385 [Nitrospira sp.]|nr:hypothetical protein [Nitrospira sp.]